MKVLTTNDINKIENKLKNNKKLKRSEKVFYQGENGLLKNINFLRTESELNEYVKCSNDIIYFIRNYCLNELYDYQIKILNSFVNNRFNITAYSRCCDYEYKELISLWVIWLIIFSEKKILSIEDKIMENVELYKTIKKYYKIIPYFLKHNIITINSKEIKLSNGSCVLFSNYSATIIDKIDVFLFDNFSKIKSSVINKIYQEIFMLTTTDSSKQIKIGSTINGNNLFYKILKDAEENNNLYKSNRIYWYDNPNRDERWKKNEINKVGKEVFKNEYDFEFNNKIKYNYYNEDFIEVHDYFDKEFIDFVENIHEKYGDDNLPYIKQNKKETFNVKSGDYIISIKQCDT